MHQTTAPTRRDVVRGAAAIAAGGLVASAIPAAAHADEAGSVTYADTIAWSGTYDVIVIGFGIAGSVAASSAADKGANVLLCDAAPEGEHGGNSRFCGQKFLYGVDRAELETYVNALFWHMDLDPEMHELWLDSLSNMDTILTDFMGVEPDCQDEVLNSRGVNVVHEYSDFPGQETMRFLSYDSVLDARIFTLMSNQVAQRADKISVWLSSPARHLIQDPQTGAIIGAVIERNGEELNIRALNGVCLTCGGFECNTKMIQDYLGTPRMTFVGGAYNNGDGIAMAMEVGADLWHMDVYEGGSVPPVPDPGDGNRTVGSLDMMGSCIVVAEDGSRYVNETAISRHGHVWAPGNVYRNPVHGWHPYTVFDQAKYDEYVEAGKMDIEAVSSNLVSADTIEELAEACGMNPETLAKTIKNYNFFCEQGEDYELRRDPETMAPFSEEGPFYAVLCVPAVLNTQGGPRRNTKAQVLDPFGEPIPHLYSAGELGGICAFQYQGGGNLAEAMAFGKIAGENAAEPKDDTVAINVEPKASTDDFGPGKNCDVIEVEEVKELK